VNLLHFQQFHKSTWNVALPAKNWLTYWTTAISAKASIKIGHPELLLSWAFFFLYGAIHSRVFQFPISHPTFGERTHDSSDDADQTLEQHAKYFVKRQTFATRIKKIRVRKLITGADIGERRESLHILRLSDGNKFDADASMRQTKMDCRLWFFLIEQCGFQTSLWTIVWVWCPFGSFWKKKDFLFKSSICGL